MVGLRRRSLIIGVGAGALAIALYGTRLSQSPIYLMHDELKFALQAQAIAATGRDMSGVRAPVYFTEPEFPAGRDPVIIYVTAMALRVLPLSEQAARLPTALVGSLDILLMFLVAERLFRRDWAAVIAAGLIALAPAHFIRSRLVLSPQYTLPFILAWLYVLDRSIERGTAARAAAAGFCLGLGMYTYLAGVVMMPVYLTVTLGVLWWRREQRFMAAAVAGFAVALLPMAAWHVMHPERIGQIVSAYRLSGVAQGTFGAAAALTGLRHRLDVYWSAFNPDFLFLQGDVSLINSTRQAGVFAWALAIFLPVGAYHLMRGGGGVMGRVIVGGLLTAPMATALSGSLEMNRVLFIVPFGALTAAYGARALLHARHVAVRWLTVALLVSVPIQFMGFYQDYRGPYRARSSMAFGGDLRSALLDLFRDQPAGPPPLTLISRQIPYADRYWHFYAIMAHREDLLNRLEYFDEFAFAPDVVAAGTFVVCAVGQPSCDVLARATGWDIVKDVVEPNGTHSFGLYRKRG